MDTTPIKRQLKRLANDPAMNIRHRRIVDEAFRIINALSIELENYQELEDLFETNERLQTALAEELEKQA